MCRVSDPGEAYEADIVAIMRDGNATEALKARQLEDFLKVTDRCTPSKAVKSGAGTTNPTALASVLVGTAQAVRQAWVLRCATLRFAYRCVLCKDKLQVKPQQVPYAVWARMHGRCCILPWR